MIDERSQKNIETLDPKARDNFARFLVHAKAIASDLGCDVKIIGGNRTWKEQDALYAKGRTLPGNRVTNAKGGQSNHNFGIAADFGVFQGGKYLDDSNPKKANEVYRAIAKVCSDYGLEWGGNWKTFKDYPHFEIATGKTLAQKRSLYNKHSTVLV